MSYLAGTLFFITGIINLAPIIGASSAAVLRRLYDIEPSPTDTSLLLQHRAILLGVVGALLISAAWQSHLRPTAAIVGLTSMVTYAVLILLSPSKNVALIKVAWIDVGATICLLLGLVIHYRTASS